ncbi:MAG: DUF2231 domain-containing protein [Gammaproteobacteria bacterium]|nr:DUF2231 domain-containing protein [Gammaproteobacteria bacterium]
MIDIIPNWHPFFVHFAIALLLIATSFHIVAALSSKSAVYYQFENVANWNLWVGAVFALITAIAGWFAFNSVEHDTPSHLAMIDHRNWALGTTILFLILAIWSFKRSRKAIAIDWLITAPLIIASALLGITGWKGAELVYRHGLGVMSLPKTGAHDHAGHEHGAEDHAHGEQDIVVPTPEDAGKEADQEVGEKSSLHDQDVERQQDETNSTNNGKAANTDSKPSDHPHDHGDHTH